MSAKVDMIRRIPALLRSLAWLAAGAGAIASAPVPAQQLADVRSPDTPLVLKRQGSFLVGGDSVIRSGEQLSSIFGQPMPNGGHVTINQMYVQFMEPVQVAGLPVVMLHGATLSGKTYETTPDGRMGWNEYFVRRGYPVYVPDQVSRGRSGFDTAAYNDVRSGRSPGEQLPTAFRFSDELAWTLFRFGPSSGTPFADGLFPIAAASQIAAQALPDLNAGLPQPNPTYRALAALSGQLDGAVLMGHSQSGAFPLEAALTDPTGVRGAILIEPPFCDGSPQRFTDAQTSALAKIPILVVFGDHLEQETGMAGFSWKTAFDNCQAFIDRVNKAGGRATMLYPPSIGIRGNSHMIMQDRNNLQIADMIIDWMAKEAPAATK